jgi:hypothetical protein
VQATTNVFLLDILPDITFKTNSTSLNLTEREKWILIGVCIAVGCRLVLALCCWCFCCCTRRRCKKKEKTDPPTSQDINKLQVNFRLTNTGRRSIANDDYETTPPPPANIKRVSSAGLSKRAAQASMALNKGQFNPNWTFYSEVGATVSASEVHVQHPGES